MLTSATMKKVLLSAQITRPSVLVIGPKTLPASPAPTYGAGYAGIGLTYAPYRSLPFLSTLYPTHALSSVIYEVTGGVMRGCVM